MTAIILPALPAPGLLVECAQGFVHGYTTSAVRSLLEQTARATLEKAAQEAQKRAADVRKANTYRGRVNEAANFVGDQLELLADVLRGIQVKEGES